MPRAASNSWFCIDGLLLPLLNAAPCRRPDAWNTLLDSKANQYKFIDPDGLFIERAHDLSISMREWSAELLAADPIASGPEALRASIPPHRRAAKRHLAMGLHRAIVNGLRYLEVGPEENAIEFIAVVEAWAQVESL